MCDYWPNDCNLAVVLWWHAAHCDAAHAFINSARAQGGVCFVHCVAGRNRSVALCAAHVRTHARKTRQAWMNFQAVRILGSFVDWMLQMMRFDMHGKRCFLKMRRRMLACAQLILDGMSLLRAITTVGGCRPQCLSNEGFLLQVRLHRISSAFLSVSPSAKNDSETAV
jgi:hypothetical protein